MLSVNDDGQKEHTTSVSIPREATQQQQVLVQQQQQQQVEERRSSCRDATVMGMATNYGVREYKRFVGSLRNTGFQGHVILAISPQPLPGVEDYLNSQNVTMKRLTLVNCTTNILQQQMTTTTTTTTTIATRTLTSHDLEVMTCAHPYPDLKVRWGRFGLLRDYLLECQECTGPVLVTDVRDTFFQRNPFGFDAPPVRDGQLQVFEEHRIMQTTHWLVKQPVERCKPETKPIVNHPMLCSGTTIGTRDAMLQYLNDMVDEMKLWMQDPKCCCNKMNGDDQSIHNYLYYYAGKLPYAQPQRNRVGLVHTVGSQGAMIFNEKRKRNMELGNMTQRQASIEPYIDDPEQRSKGRWLSLSYDLTDDQGYFIDFDGQRSFIVHQYDRFGMPLEDWLDNLSGLYQPQRPSMYQPRPVSSQT